MNFKHFFVMLVLCGPLGVSANQAATKQSELDALKQRLQALQQDFHATLAETGALEDISPTLLKMMGVAQPPEMTGEALVQFE